MKTTNLFKHGESQVVQLPKKVHFEGDEVPLMMADNAAVLPPNRNSWDALVDSLAQFNSDFMAKRGQPARNDCRDPL